MTYRATVLLRHVAAIGLFSALTVGSYFLFSYTWHWSWFSPLAGTWAIALGSPGSPMAAPKNMIGGHLCGLLAGLAVVWFMPAGSAVLATGTCLAFSMMLVLRCLHSPAGATPAVIATGGAECMAVATMIGIGIAVTLMIQRPSHWFEQRVGASRAAVRPSCHGDSPTPPVVASPPALCGQLAKGNGKPVPAVDGHDQ